MDALSCNDCKELPNLEYCIEANVHLWYFSKNEWMDKFTVHLMLKTIHEEVVVTTDILVSKEERRKLCDCKLIDRFKYKISEHLLSVKDSEIKDEFRTVINCARKIVNDPEQKKQYRHN